MFGSPSISRHTHSVTELIDATLVFLGAGWSLIAVAVRLLVPVLPLLAWLAFWYFAVDWSRLGPAIRRGGWVPVAMLAVLAASIAATIVRDRDPRTIGPLSVSPTAEVIGWTLILVAGVFYAGAAQLSRRSLRR